MHTLARYLHLEEDDSLCGGCFVVVIVNHYCLLLSTFCHQLFLNEQKIDLERKTQDPGCSR